MFQSIRRLVRRSGRARPPLPRIASSIAHIFYFYGAKIEAIVTEGSDSTDPKKMRIIPFFF